MASFPWTLQLLLVLQFVSHALCQSNALPYFEDDEVPVSVLENHNKSLPILSSSYFAFDDEGDNITYSIPANGLGSLSFELKPTSDGFNIYFKNSVNIDRETKDEYQVVVLADDGMEHGDALPHGVIFIISILDINDNSPVFTNLDKTVEFDEDTDTLTLLLHVQATDDDIGKNRRIKYSIISVSPSNGHDKFSISTSSGEVRLAKELDYENVTEYSLTIEAEDHGDDPLSTLAVLTVKVIDINDNDPKFTQVLYSAQIYENLTLDSNILEVEAFDQDLMLDYDIVYSIDNVSPGGNYFAIDNETGTVYVNDFLEADFGSPQKYSLTIKGQEVVSPFRFTTTIAEITILDVNDNPPQFEHLSYNGSIAESSLIGSTVVSVRATDADQGSNAEFTFHLVNLLSNDPLPFNVSQSLDGETGSIQLAAALDFETIEQYKIEVIATEVLNNMTKTASTTVTIFVTNINDNFPVFDQTEYSVNISESSQTGTIFGKVLAEDDDKGVFGVVRYYLGNFLDIFEINQVGEIKLLKKLDYEEVKSYALTVLANDSAPALADQLKSQVQVHVTVIDANDNPPIISVNGSDTVEEVTRSVEEQQDPGVLVFVIDADDVDEFPNDVLEYFIEVLEPSGLNSSHFDYSVTAVNQLVTSIQLDYEKIQKYKLRACVTDYGDLINEVIGSGSGAMVKYMSVNDLPSDHVDCINIIVKVVDENDNPPRFVREDGVVIDSYAFDVVEEQVAGTLVGFANATDADSELFGTVRYFISGVDHENFTINNVTGEILTAGPIDREQKDRFDLIVTAHDLDPVNPLSATATLTITIIDINDNVPMFSQPVYVENDIFENSNEINIQVSATDADINENDDLTYEIIDGNTKDQFIINSATGLIQKHPNVTLDREETPEFQLIIQVTDGGAIPLASNASVFIDVQDINDNEPLFESNDYNVNVNEGTSIGSQILTVKANDDDEGPNGVVRYSIIPGVDDQSFSIGQTSGVITTNQAFDFDTEKSIYFINIKAQDNGEVSKESIATVEITIIDVNDNSPQFSKVQYLKSISENVAGGTSLTSVHATDIDSGMNKQIKYSISNVTTVGIVEETDEEAYNTTDLFTIDEDTGEIYLSDDRSLDYESVTDYTIVVKAQDGGSSPKTDSSIVRITVLDYNDNSPMLSADAYSFDIDEDTAKFTTFDMFMYDDEDSGSNAIATYSIINTNAFKISEDSGVLTLVEPLDYNAVHFFVFIVKVTDGGSPQLTDTATVSVTVIDVNDNAPMFVDPASSPLAIDLDEGDYRGSLSKLLYNFNASDDDAGVNSQLNFSISNGDLSLFSINSVTGQLRVIDEIDRESEDYYELTVTVKDGGTPTQSATVPVEITVTDVNEEPPMFMLDSYSKTIAENNQVGVSLVQVQAEDSDLGVNAMVTYSVNDTDFNISSDGVIETNSNFDYEQVNSIDVLVTATDGGGMYSTVIFTLFLTDLNDNDPKFVNTFTTPFEIPENEEVGYEVAVANATDDDSGANGDISYSLAGALGKFDISSSGKITLVSKLDREVDEYYYLTVIAVDHGSSNQKTSSTSINITVTDINDEYPVFEPSFYTAEKNEDTSLSSTIVTVAAYDDDIGNNGEITFAITSGDTNVFSISTEYDSVNNEYKGYIVLLSNLDYETETSYSLQISATDKGSSPLTSTAFVSIKVTNINDEVPMFSPSDSYTFSISEIAVEGTPVGTILASDNDAGVFGKITSYGFNASTDADTLANFDISSSTGVITLSNTSNLDYDNGKQSYLFAVTATDGGSVSSTASVTVNVLGHNEEAPNFNIQSYTGSITENQEINQDIVQVTAIDPDNAPIIYSIIEGNTDNRFKIDNSGQITNAKKLDREQKEVYVLRIQAADSDVNPLYGYTQVQITVFDVNDNSPEFPGSNVLYKVLENTAETLSPVIAATDADTGDNSLLFYSAVGEGIPDVFHVNNATAEIEIVGTLNFEYKTQYSFIITAQDSGMDPMNDTLNVTIEILDFNDNAPEFNQNGYASSVYESVPTGSIVAVVFANDSDSGENAKIVYSISEADKFAINSVGEISLKQQLNYEMVSSYSLIVTATDEGTPPRAASTTVELTVLDANDEAPVFVQSSYSYTIKEQDIVTQVSLLPVTATDKDGTSPNNLVTYNITNGNEDKKFIIDNNGELFAVKSLDYELDEVYTLEVTAMDNPDNITDRKSNSVMVVINVEDINDNSPVWKEGTYRNTPNQFSGKIHENATEGTTVLFIEATDEDSGVFGQVTYSFLTPSDKFYINATSGIIYTYGDLDVALVDLYNLTVVARDGGSKSTIGYVNIEVIDINDKVPSFISSFFYKEVKEDVDVSYSVITLTAFDIDSEDLTYSIMDGGEGFFKINSTTGEVGLAKSLDREEVDDFLLTVFVSDGLFNDTTNLRVVVLDVNDNAPEFVDAPYFANIPENTVEGAVLLFNSQMNTTLVFALDADQPDTPNSIVVYEMVGMNADVLNIEPSKGVLTVASGANLDFETAQTVVVEVKAQDSVLSAKSSTTTITIHVQDVNDNAPEFAKTSYSAAVKENEPASTIITSDIEASDVDTKLGGVITYSIVSSTPSGNLDKFTINGTTGVVMLQDSLDREVTDIITLTIRATDGGPSTFNTAEVSLIVNIIDVNDNSPVFNDSLYFKSVPESIGVKQPVVTVLATDDDVNNNAVVRYSLLNHQDVFDINKGTGVITTITELDHEMVNYYSILVRACDNGNTSLCSDVTVSVQVTDINDLFPVYDYDVYYTSLCEDATPVSTVLQVIALDGDSGDYGKVTYSLASGSNLGDLFTLDENTGVIELVDYLTDDNTDETVVVDIIASDGGSPSKSATTQVQIFFCVIENATIFFNESLYYGVVTENEVPPVNITSVTAFSTYSPITYSILPLKTDNYFEISQSGGMITTTKVLDREERATYTLVIKAEDSAAVPNTAYATVSVAVLDINDNPPMFLLPPYMFTLVEELSYVKEIDSVVAVDPDKPFNPNGVTYSIESASNPNGVFTINENGTIFATKPVDRETIPQYNLRITATDTDPSDPRIATATATVTILDVNDNSPVFDTMVNYTATVSENHPPNFSIFKVSATDADSDLNREVVYSIYSGGEGKFFVDSTSGVIKTLAQLDYETQSFYNITIMAQDKGTNPQESFISLYVTVEDYNDCTPMFNETSYSAVLKEDFGSGTILDIGASDCDSGVNKDITFSILTGNADSRFELNPDSGVLSLINPLDFETKQSYNLQIQAKDGGDPSRSSLVQVFIEVTDVNDETPKFGQNQYKFEIDEDSTVNFEFITVIATDNDGSDENSNLEYAILTGNTNDDFAIDPETGAVRVNKPLDRERTDSYFMIIGATDTGDIPRSANTTLAVTVLDVNDNPPIIENLTPGLVLNVSEDSKYLMVLYDVDASDADINENALLQFSLQNYEDLFFIHPSTGVINLLGELDYDDSVTEYQLSIEVTDLAIGGETRLTDQATLNIQVQDVNDNDPIFVQDKYVVLRPEEEEPGQVFTTVEATDNDGTIQNNKITYTLTDCVPSCTNSFSVDPSTGDVTNAIKLDRETEDNFTLTIMAINLNAQPERNDSTTVVVTITDVNDHPPQFTEPEYSTSIFEGVASSTSLLTFKATDLDQINTLNTELSYKIASVIPNNPFLINEDTGVLEVTGNIDRESVPFYNFTVRVEDNGADAKLHDDVQVLITVKDVNDQRPLFISNTYNTRVNEGLTSNDLPYLLWSPGYVDNDELPENALSQYNILSMLNGTSSLGSSASLININETSGEVWLMSFVDFETTKELTVIISVNNTKIGTGETCGGFDSSCSLSDIAWLNIEISDFNDNVPLFDSESYTGQISTSAIPGTQIRQLVALDKDSQNDYGEVRYRLGDASSTKFNIISDSGWVISRGNFENDDRKDFTITIEAYDNLGNEPSRTSSVEMTITALSDFRRVLIVFNKESSAFTQEKEQMIIDILHNMTGYTIILEEIRDHLVEDTGDVDTTKTDFIFHAVDENGNIVDFDELLQKLDVGAFFNAILECEPISISALRNEEDYPKVQSIMIVLIVLCGVILIGAIIVLILACQQRYIALNSLWKNQLRDAFYGASDPSIIEGAVPRELSGEQFEMRGMKTNKLYVEPYNTSFGAVESGSMIGSSLGDIDSIQQGNPLYEERELKMEMFEVSDDETDGDLDDDNLLAEALKDDESGSGSVTAI